MTTTDRLTLEEVIRNGNRQCLDIFCSNCPFNTTKNTCGLAAIKRVFYENIKKDEERS